MSENETVADIVREMRSFAMSSTATGSQCKRNIYVYADRIEAAYNRLAIPTPEQWTEFARQGSELAALAAKNRILAAALRKMHDYAKDFATEANVAGYVCRLAAEALEEGGAK